MRTLDRISVSLLHISKAILRFWETAQLPLPWANINTYFSLKAKCWLRRGVGGQFPRNVKWSQKPCIRFHIKTYHYLKLNWRNISVLPFQKINPLENALYAHSRQNIPLKTDFNFDKLFLSNLSPTNSHRVNRARNNTYFAKPERRYFLFATPPTPGAGPLQTIPHLVLGVARGGGGW